MDWYEIALLIIGGILSCGLVAVVGARVALKQFIHDLDESLVDDKITREELKILAKDCINIGVAFKVLWRWFVGLLKVFKK